MTFEVDVKLEMAKKVYDEMNENSKEEIKRLIAAGNNNYYEGYFDALSQVHNAFNTSVDAAQQSCSRLIVLAYIILHHEDLNILEERKYVN